MPFWGGPLFDAKGLLAGVGTPKGVVPASVLSDVLARSSASR
jgi:hypothetical protein